MLKELNERTQTVLRYVVDSYMHYGDPVGSRTIREQFGLNLSPATIRNVMAELESSGYLYAPHVSAGRIPTESGLRLYVDGLMEIGNLSSDTRAHIETECNAAGHSINSLLDQATSLLSGLSSAASLVIAPKTEKPIRQIQFVQISHQQILIIIVMQDGMVENRLMEVTMPVTESALAQAANYLNKKLSGKTLSKAKQDIDQDIRDNKTQLNALSQNLVEKGIAVDVNTLQNKQNVSAGHMIVRGQSNLLNDIKAIEDLEKARLLMAALEEQNMISKLLGASKDAEGVQIFIGTENSIFDHAGWSMLISPYKDADNTIIGALGVIGPMRLNYGQIIPLLDYTTKVVENILDK